MTQSFSQKSGFTLLEITLVLGIISILLSGAIYAYNQFDYESAIRRTIDLHKQIVLHIKSNRKILKVLADSNTISRDTLQSLDILPEKFDTRYPNNPYGNDSIRQPFRVPYGDMVISDFTTRSVRVMHVFPSNNRASDCTKIIMGLGYVDGPSMRAVGITAFGADGYGDPPETLSGPISVANYCRTLPNWNNTGNKLALLQFIYSF